MKRSVSLLLSLLLVLLICVMFCHEAFHNDADGGLCVICSWIVFLRGLLCAAFTALVFISFAMLSVHNRKPAPADSPARHMTPVALYVKITD